MPARNPPIRVNPSALPSAIYSTLRSALAILGSVAVSLRWIEPDKVEGIATMILVAVSVGYGAWKHFTKSESLIVLEPYAPDSVAKLK